MILHAALTLAEKGMAVFPCQPRDKRPATERGYLDATTEAVIIKRWWRKNPDFNIAIATGTISGVFVGDIDGADAEAELRKLELRTAYSTDRGSDHCTRPSCLLPDAIEDRHP